VFGADAREIQLDVPRVSSSPGDDVAENGGDLRIGQFVMGYLEQHATVAGRQKRPNSLGSNLVTAISLPLLAFQHPGSFVQIALGVVKIVMHQ